MLTNQALPYNDNIDDFARFAKLHIAPIRRIIFSYCLHNYGEYIRKTYRNNGGLIVSFPIIDN